MGEALRAALPIVTDDTGPQIKCRRIASTLVLQAAVLSPGVNVVLGRLAMLTDTAYFSLRLYFKILLRRSLYSLFERNRLIVQPLRC